MDRYYRLGLILVAIACFLGSAFPLSKSEPPGRFADLTPAARYDAGPYVAPVGCVSRRWHEGDFMPSACQKGEEMDGATIGLAHDKWMEYAPHRPRRYMWVRAGPDVVLAACPLMMACRIYQVVPDRFVPKPQDSPAVEEAVPEAFRRAPLAYRLTRYAHAFLLMPFGLFTLALGLMPSRLFLRTR